MKTVCHIVIAVALLTLGAFTGWHARPDRQVAVIRTDTVVVRDTIRDTVPVPVRVLSVRIERDTLRLAGDTVYIEVEVPFERKIYQTDDYRAEIEGFRASLVSMNIYRQTQFVTQTNTIRVPDAKRFGLGLQAGYGMTLRGGRPIGVPYVGVGVSYNITKW